MKSTDRLKDKVEKTETKEIIKEMIEDEEMTLSEDELDSVSGGGDYGTCFEPRR